MSDNKNSALMRDKRHEEFLIKNSLYRDDFGYFKKVVRHFEELSNPENPLYNEEECDQARKELVELVAKYETTNGYSELLTGDETILFTFLLLKRNGRSAKMLVQWTSVNELNNNEITIIAILIFVDGLSFDITENDPETAGLFRLAKYETNRIFESM